MSTDESFVYSSPPDYPRARRVPRRRWRHVRDPDPVRWVGLGTLVSFRDLTVPELDPPPAPPLAIRPGVFSACRIACSVVVTWPASQVPMARDVALARSRFCETSDSSSHPADDRRRKRTTGVFRDDVSRRLRVQRNPPLSPSAPGLLGSALFSSRRPSSRQ